VCPQKAPSNDRLCKPDIYNGGTQVIASERGAPQLTVGNALGVARKLGRRIVFDVHQVGEATIIDVAEDLDMCTSSALESTINLAALDLSKRVIVSLEKCLYCDASGLNVLVKARKRLGSMLLVVVPRANRIRRIFHITGLEEILSLSASLHDAVMPTRLQIAPHPNGVASSAMAAAS